MADDEASLRDKFDGSTPVLEATCKSADIAIGEILVLENDRIEPPESEKEKLFGLTPKVLALLGGAEKLDSDDRSGFVQTELRRYQDALDRTIATYEGYLLEAKENGCVEVADIAVRNLSSELDFLRDASLFNGVPGSIEGIKSRIEQGQSAEVAIDGAYQEWIDFFGGMGSPKHAKTAVELGQHRATIQHHIHPDKTLATPERIRAGTVVVSKELALSALSHFYDHKTRELLVEGVVTGSGSMESHAAFLVQGMGPAYARSDTDRMKTGDICIIDGVNGRILLHPRADVVEEYRTIMKTQDKMRDDLQVKWASHRSAQTRDGTKINVHANFGASFEADAIRKANPVGIGLYRPEICDMMRGDNAPPSVDTWKNIFLSNMQACSRDGSESGLIGTTIRTIDLAGDKSQIKDREERNARQLEITKTQMRAFAWMYRELEEKGKLDKLKIMIPMVESAEHMAKMQALMDEQAKKALEDRIASLTAQLNPTATMVKPPEGAERIAIETEIANLERDIETGNIPKIKLGCMYEIPALSGDLATIETSFISVGSNDLIHALLDIDRYSRESIKKYDPTNRTVLHDLKRVVDVGRDRGIPVSICGDMASESKYTALLIGLGYRNLSADPNSVPIVKEISSRVDVAEAEALFETLYDPKWTRAQREEILADFNEKRLGLDKNGKVDLDWDGPTEEWTPPAPGVS